jgi:DNA-binding XRE family transcriptional regulator
MKTPTRKPKVSVAELKAIASLPKKKSTNAEIAARRAERDAKPKVAKAKPAPKPKPAPKAVEKETPRNDHEFTPAALIAWREKLGISQREAAKALGTARQSYSNYEAGKAAIPKFIALACQALAAKQS